ncbi:MAG: DsrE family protein [Bacillota bacterium]
MAKICILVQTGPYTYENLDTALALARSAKGAGVSVALFLYVDGVISVNSKIDSPGERNLSQLLADLIREGVEVSACGACSKFRGITKQLYVDGATMGSIVDMAEMLEDADALVSLGF